MHKAIRKGMFGVVLLVGMLTWGALWANESHIAAIGNENSGRECVKDDELCRRDRQGLAEPELDPVHNPVGAESGGAAILQVAISPVAMHPVAPSGMHIPAQVSKEPKGFAGESTLEGGESGTLIPRYMIAVLAALVGIVALSRRRVS